MIFIIAHDSDPMRQSIKRFLMRKVPDGHRFFEAADGTEAVRLYQTVHPDWVLMDIAMLPMDGLEASHAILEIDPDAKIIILSQYADAAYQSAARDVGTKAHVLKDHMSDLLSILSPRTVGGSLG